MSGEGECQIGDMGGTTLSRTISQPQSSFSDQLSKIGKKIGTVKNTLNGGDISVGVLARFPSQNTSQGSQLPQDIIQTDQQFHLLNND